MGFARRTLKLCGGLVLGSAVGTAVSVLLAPQSGPELQGAWTDRLSEAERAGEEAEILERERLKREFRAAVNDPTALTGRHDQPGGTAAPVKTVETEQAKAQRDARKAQDAVEAARKKAAKEQADAEKAREAVAKAEAEAAKKRREADKVA